MAVARMTSIEESIEDALREGGVPFPADASLEDKVRFDQLVVQMDYCCSQKDRRASNSCVERGDKSSAHDP